MTVEIDDWRAVSQTHLAESKEGNERPPGAGDPGSAFQRVVSERPRGHYLGPRRGDSRHLLEGGRSFEEQQVTVWAYDTSFEVWECQRLGR